MIFNTTRNFCLNFWRINAYTDIESDFERGYGRIRILERRTRISKNGIRDHPLGRNYIINFRLIKSSPGYAYLHIECLFLKEIFFFLVAILILSGGIFFKNYILFYFLFIIFGMLFLKIAEKLQFPVFWVYILHILGFF